jgi:hypothetical protein
MGNTCSGDKSTETKDGSNPPQDKPAEEHQNDEHHEHTDGQEDHGTNDDDRPEGEA